MQHCGAYKFRPVVRQRWKVKSKFIVHYPALKSLLEGYAAKERGRIFSYLPDPKLPCVFAKFPPNTLPPPFVSFLPFLSHFLPIPHPIFFYFFVLQATHRRKDDKGNWNAAQIAPIPSDLAVNWWGKKLLFRFSSPVFRISPLFIFCLLTLHRKKRFTSFPYPAGMSLTKLPLGRNNSVMTSLFPPRESLVVTSRLGTGNSRTFFYGVSLYTFNVGTPIFPYECPPPKGRRDHELENHI